MNTHITPTTVPLSSLTLWEGNVRKTDRTAGLSELADNIQANGLINPLTIYFEDDKAFVVAGQRRLLALQLLLKEGRLGEDHPVAVSPIDKAQALQISLAENVIREDMHDADRFEAFNGLTKEGLTPTEIANRFGLEEARVMRILKLGRVNPKLLDLFRKDELNLEQMMAFTLTDNQKEQMRVWNGLKNLHGWQKGAGAIRAAITKEEIEHDDKRVIFIGGLEAYEAAGGVVRRDLFSKEEGAGFVSDVVLLEKLFSEKVEAERAAVFAEGWKWAEFRQSFDWNDRKGFHEEASKRVPLTDEQKADQKTWEEERRALQKLDEMTDEQDARYDELTEKLEDLENRPTAVARSAMARSGAIITVEHNGKLKVYRGFTRKEDMPKQKGVKVEEPAVSAKSAFSNALTDSLEREATAAMQAELALRPDLALKGIVYAAIVQYGSGFDITFRNGPSNQQSPAGTALMNRIAELTDGMPDKDEVESEEIWKWVDQQTPEKLSGILAYFVARSASDKHLDFLREPLGLNLRTWFTPAADNYFGKVGKPQIVADLQEMGVPTETINAYASLKKGELAAKAEGHAAEAINWIPKPMRLEA